MTEWEAKNRPTSTDTAYSIMHDGTLNIFDENPKISIDHSSVKYCPRGMRGVPCDAQSRGLQKSLEGSKVIGGHLGEQRGKNRKKSLFFRNVKGGCPSRAPYCPHILADDNMG